MTQTEPHTAPSAGGQRAVLRYEVPVDDGWHVLRLSGPILHVAARRRDVLDVWVLAGQEPETDRAFLVVGTGQRLAPAAATYRGTALAAGGALVWHLFEHETVRGGESA